MSNSVEVPPRSDPRWDMVADGRIQRPWVNLAMKIMMARISQEIAKDRTEANVQRCADQIFEFFIKNEKAAARDLRAIFH